MSLFSFPIFYLQPYLINVASSSFGLANNEHGTYLSQNQETTFTAGDINLAINTDEISEVVVMSSVGISLLREQSPHVDAINALKLFNNDQNTVMQVMLLKYRDKQVFIRSRLMVAICLPSYVSLW